MNLTDQEKFKIRELRNDPVYGRLLQRISDEYSLINLYKPGAAKQSDEQFSDFVFGSGRVRGVQLVLGILGYGNDDRES